MFFDPTQAGLKDGLDHIAVPVFAIDRGPDSRFRIAAINEALCRTTGLLNRDVAGATPHDILPAPGEAEAVIAHYVLTMDRREVSSYRETLTFGENRMTFDTTLHPVGRSGFRAPERLIGTALRVVDSSSTAADLDWFLAQSETALLALADIVQHSAGGAGVGPDQQAAFGMMVRNVRSSLEQLRLFTGGAARVPGLMNKTGIPPEVKRHLN